MHEESFILFGNTLWFLGARMSAESTPQNENFASTLCNRKPIKRLSANNKLPCSDGKLQPPSQKPQTYLITFKC